MDNVFNNQKKSIITIKNQIHNIHLQHICNNLKNILLLTYFLYLLLFPLTIFSNIYLVSNILTIWHCVHSSINNSFSKIIQIQISSYLSNVRTILKILYKNTQFRNVSELFDIPIEKLFDCLSYQKFIGKHLNWIDTGWVLRSTHTQFCLIFEWDVNTWNKLSILENPFYEYSKSFLLQMNLNFIAQWIW